MPSSAVVASASISSTTTSVLSLLSSISPSSLLPYSFPMESPSSNSILDSPGGSLASSSSRYHSLAGPRYLKMGQTCSDSIHIHPKLVLLLHPIPFCIVIKALLAHQLWYYCRVRHDLFLTYFLQCILQCTLLLNICLLSLIKLP